MVNFGHLVHCVGSNDNIHIMRKKDFSPIPKWALGGGGGRTERG